MATDKMRSSERGQSVVELALLLPFLLTLVLGVVDLGMGVRTYIGLTNAAREGARWVSIHPTDPYGAMTRIGVEASRVGVTNTGSPATGMSVTFTPLRSAYSAGENVTVAIHHDYPLMFGMITAIPNVPFRAQTTMVVLYDD